jgi:hypothetical protein
MRHGFIFITVCATDIRMDIGIACLFEEEATEDTAFLIS